MYNEHVWRNNQSPALDEINLNEMEGGIGDAHTLIQAEVTARQTAVAGLQSQIDAIVSKSDIVDIVGTYAELLEYDTSTLRNKDIIKVLEDETHDDARSYYKWVVVEDEGSWEYVGSEADGYTKEEADALFVVKVAGKGLSTNDYTDTEKGKVASALQPNDSITELAEDSSHRTVTDAEKATWNGKQNAISDLASIRSGAEKGETAVQPEDLPAIPTKVSQLQNDSGFLNEANADELYVQLEEGMGLSENDYSDTEKAKVDSALQPDDNISELNNDAGYLTQEDTDDLYVAKETGKGLSSNDFTDEDKTKLNSALQPEDDISKLNNNVGYALQEDVDVALEEKANTDGYYDSMTVGLAENLIGTPNPTQREIVYTPTNASLVGSSWIGGSVGGNNATIEKIKGNTIVKNQLIDETKEIEDTEVAYRKSVPNNSNRATIKNFGGKSVVLNQLVGELTETGTTHGVVFTNNNNNSMSVVGTENEGGNYSKLISREAFTITANHKYLWRIKANDITEAGTGYIYINSGISNRLDMYDANVGNNEFLVTATADSNNAKISFVGKANETVNFEIADIQLVDLTQMFGVGNEPSTVEEVEAIIGTDYIEYNTGEIVNAVVDSVDSVGFNLWDEEWELGDIAFGTGSNVSSSSWIRSKNYSKIIGNTLYALTLTKNIYVFLYDKNNQYIGRTTGLIQVASRREISIPSGACYFRLSQELTTYNNDICINVSNEALNGTYKPYMTPDSKTIPDEVKALPLYGASAGNVYNEIDWVNKKYIQRVGSVDLGDLDWSTVGQAFYSSALVGIVKERPTNAGFDNITSSRFNAETYTNVINGLVDRGALIVWTESTAHGRLYIRDSAYSTTTEFKTAMDGVLFYYELATPIITDISDILTDDNYLTVESGGTLTFTQSDLELPIPNAETFRHTAWTEPLDTTHRYAFSDNGVHSLFNGQSSVSVVGAEDKLVDLTRAFGSNAPTSIAELNDLMPSWNTWDFGTELVNFNGSSIVTNGFNQLDNDGHIKVIPNMTYHIEGTYTSLKDSDGNDVPVVDNEFTPTKADTYTMVGGECVHFRWTGLRNGETEDYWSSNKIIEVNRYFTDGMKSAGTVFDELQYNRYVQRIGVVDLGDINWETSSYGFYCGGSSIPNNVTNNDQNTVGNIVCSRYATYTANSITGLVNKGIGLRYGGGIVIGDTSYTDATAFKTAMSGVLLYYELAEPVVTPISPVLNLNYRAEDYGTEFIYPDNSDGVETSPLEAEIIYQLDYEATVRTLITNYTNKKSLDNLTTALGNKLGLSISSVFDPQQGAYVFTVEEV